MPELEWLSQMFLTTLMGPCRILSLFSRMKLELLAIIIETCIPNIIGRQYRAFGSPCSAVDCSQVSLWYVTSSIFILVCVSK
jgi:hypothetical protein